MHDSRTPSHRFYGELAGWWPLISPVEEYEEEAMFAVSVLRDPASDPRRRAEVLELGSGGGHMAAHLKAHFTMTLTDLSEEMLAVSQLINPECEHLQGDMRTLRLGRTFDAVFVHDAVDYMTTEVDLAAAIHTAFEHCRPGGRVVFMPDAITETFEPSSDHGGADGADGRGVRFLDWTRGPDGDDTWTETDYVFLLREADGSVRSVHETHRTALFPQADWLRLLAAAGFDAEPVVEVTSEARTPRVLFVGHRAAPIEGAGPR